MFSVRFLRRSKQETRRNRLPGKKESMLRIVKGYLDTEPRKVTLEEPSEAVSEPLAIILDNSQRMGEVPKD